MWNKEVVCVVASWWTPVYNEVDHYSKSLMSILNLFDIQYITVL